MVPSITHSWGGRGRGGGGGELNEDLLSPYIRSKLGATQDNAHAQVAKEPKKNYG
jgi:hypothetical protein